MTYRHVLTIPGGFQSTLRAIAVDSQGRLYAAGDTDLKVFQNDGKLLRRWATARQGFGVAVAANGNVWVGQSGQVEIFSAQGRPVAAWRDEKLLGRVSAIGFGKEIVFLGDAKYRCIRRYEAGKYAASIGDENRTHGLVIPNGVVSFSIGRDGTLHTANPGKHRVERYSPTGQLLGHIGRFDGIDPVGFQGCCNPTNVALGAGDLIYVTEKADPRAKVYDLDGKLLSVIASGVFDRNSKNMSIAVDRNGRVFVADTVRREILAFAPVG